MIFVGLKRILCVCAVALLAASSQALAQSAQPSVQALPSHYEVSLKTDLPISLLGAFTCILGNYRVGEMSVPAREDIPKVSRLLPWDRPIAGRYSESADKASDYAAVLGLMPLALGGYSWLVGDARGSDFASYSLMFVEALALQSGVNLMVRSLALWPRPYIYAESGDGAKEALKADGEAYGSFFSGHASAAFTVAVFTGEWFGEVYPNSPYKSLVWAGSLSAAGLVGVLRIAAGKHYPTDVIVGALVGTGISFSIVELHKKTAQRISLWAGFNSAGLTARF